MTLPWRPTKIPRSWMAPSAGLLLAGLLCLLAWARISSWASDPGVSLLVGECGAEWIKVGEPFHLSCRRLGITTATFRKRFEVKAAPKKASLTVHAHKATAAWLDGQLIIDPERPFEEWRTPLRADLTGLLDPGTHEIRIQVVNRNGLEALLAYSEEAGIKTGKDWEASFDGATWRPPQLLSEPWRPEISLQFPSAFHALVEKLPFLLPIFLSVFLCTLYFQRKTPRPFWLEQVFPLPARVRWAVLWAWGFLAANNILKVPIEVGFDSIYHIDYILYVAERGRIPLPTEGWQMFQSPLYYLLSAPLYSFLLHFFEPPTVGKLLRIVPLLCGAAQVEVSYRGLRRVFPERNDLQVLGTILGGLLPMNLYLSQGLGNEPLAGLLSGILIVFAFRFLESPSGRSPGATMAMGLFLGLALLTKATAALLIPPLLMVLAGSSWREKKPLVLALVRVSLFLGTATAVAGWYYLRNWIALGKPFFSGWDPERGILWWQDPGYRTLDQLFKFGEALCHPIYAATHSFWDAVYSTFWADGYLSSLIRFEQRPPWNYGILLSSVLLALVPCAAVLLGGAAAFVGWKRQPGRRALLLAAACPAIYTAALLHLFVTLPIYSTAKATYTVGLVACYAVLGAAGLDLLTRRPLARAGVYGLFASWAAAAYSSYFVL